MICDARLSALRDAVSGVLGEKRYRHTLGVEEAAVTIGEFCLPDKLYELSCAALLHDIAKEMPMDEQLSIMQRSGVEFTEEDYASKALFHSFAAPTVIKERFSSFATSEVLSAVFKHTAADPVMSVFDEIIFIADFVEEGREYSACKERRTRLLSGLKDARTPEERLSVLHIAVLDVIDFTIKFLEEKGKAVNSRMLLARKSIASKIKLK